ncbi:hypothetical protein TSAR_003948 [Trichomalopsis sarcophagae]|uniref:Uncharacterized protein n=1 Tax=Trichomalopsis sarcophagae TaxID=543379 RepID=A0A232EKI3_9HYME|nr:hypothetical protein TSAR_003948 [Trichomalopsis sarcophagae]
MNTALYVLILHTFSLPLRFPHFILNTSKISTRVRMTVIKVMNLPIRITYSMLHNKGYHFLKRGIWLELNQNIERKKISSQRAKRVLKKVKDKFEVTPFVDVLPNVSCSSSTLGENLNPVVHIKKLELQGKKPVIQSSPESPSLLAPLRRKPLQLKKLEMQAKKPGQIQSSPESPSLLAPLRRRKPLHPRLKFSISPESSRGSTHDLATPQNKSPSRSPSSGSTTSDLSPPRKKSSSHTVALRSTIPTHNAPNGQPSPARSTTPAFDQPPAQPSPARSTTPAFDQPLAQPSPARSTTPAFDQPPAQPSPARSTTPAFDQPLAQPSPAPRSTTPAFDQPLAQPSPARSTTPAFDSPPAQPSPARSRTPSLRNSPPAQPSPARSRTPTLRNSPLDQPSPSRTRTPTSNSPQYVKECIEYYSKRDKPGYEEFRKRYDIINGNMIYLGEGFSIETLQWDLLQTHKPQIFLIELSVIFWGEKDLANRALDLTRGVKNIPNRSPVKLIEKEFLRLLISIYNDYLDRRGYSGEEKISFLLKTTYVIRHKIRDLRQAEIKKVHQAHAPNPRRRLRYNVKQ